MSEYRLLTDVAAALLAALAGGMLARLLRVPVLVGYVVAGIVVGPYTPGLFANEASVHAVAKLGVALLMFAVGIQFSLREMLAVRTTAILGGGAQILGTILLGFLVGRALGWGAYGSLFLGCALALSSTAVMMRVLEERGELSSGHGVVMLGILVVQDLSVVVMAALLPALSELSAGGMGALADVGVSLARALVAVGVALFLALRGVPVLLDMAARTGVRELFVLTVVCFCLGAAYLAHVAGLSLEIGAFLAGLAISETRYSPEVLAQVRPLRDLFASLFFVSIGMLLDPAFLLRNLFAVSMVVLAVVVGKALIAAAAVYATGWHGRTALFAGLGLAQIGEFSFVLAALGTQRGLIPQEISGVILSTALITILTAPFVYRAAGPLYARLSAVPAIARLLNRHNRGDASRTDEGCRGRVLILGSGRVGKHVSDALLAMGVSQVVVDYDTKAVARRRERGVPTIYGDASSEVVLAQASPEFAEFAVVALPDVGATIAAVRILKRLAPHLHVTARVHRGEEMRRVRAAGADAVIHAEFEAAAAIVRQTLERLAAPPARIERYMDDLRRERYSPSPDSPR